jgi:two-component SAPR family response regulator
MSQLSHVIDETSEPITSFDQGQEASVRIRLFGGLEISNTVESSLDVSRLRRGSLELLARLVLARAGGVSKLSFVEDVWPNHDIETGRAELNRSVYELRRLLDPAKGTVELSSSSISRTTSHLYLRRTNKLWIDVDELERLIGQSGVSSTEAVSIAKSALSLYRGPILGDVKLSVSFFARNTSLLQGLHKLIDAAVRYLLSQHAFDESASLLRGQLTHDVANEAAHRNLMVSFACAQRRTDALLQFELCKQGLRAQLGIGPGNATIELADRIRRGESIGLGQFEELLRGLPNSDYRSLDVTSPRATQQISREYSRLVGRTALLDQLKRLLLDREVRVLTLVVLFLSMSNALQTLTISLMRY